MWKTDGTFDEQHSVSSLYGVTNSPHICTKKENLIPNGVSLGQTPNEGLNQRYLKNWAVVSVDDAKKLPHLLLFKVRGLINKKGTSESRLDNGFSQESLSICGA